MAKSKDKHELVDPNAVKVPIFTLRFLVSVLLIAAGIAYVVLWTLYVRDLRAFDSAFPKPKGGAPDFLIPSAEKLKDWNWAIGFGLLFLGLIFSAHPKTPLGHGRGVVVGMLACFLIGLIWICTFYVFADRPEGEIWLLGDLGQLNLAVGIGFMAVGFTFATRWE